MIKEIVRFARCCDCGVEVERDKMSNVTVKMFDRHHPDLREQDHPRFKFRLCDGCFTDWTEEMSSIQWDGKMVERSVVVG